MTDPREMLPAYGVVGTGLTARDPGVRLVDDGWELVVLVERFYQGVFAMSAAATVGVAVLAGVLFAPLEPGHLRFVTAAAATLDALLAGLIFRQRGRLYALIRTRPAWLLVIASVVGLVLAASHPRAGPMLFPTSVTLGLSAAAANVRWTIGCAAILGIAQLVGDQAWGDPILQLTNATAADQIAAAGSYLAWALVAGVAVDRLARFVLRLNRTVTSQPGEPPVRVASRAGNEPAAERRAPLALLQSGREEGAGPDRGSDASRRLTARQLQVAVLLRDGLRYEQIARALAITERTVRRHAADAIKRLEVANVPELVAVIVAAAIVPSPASRDSSAASIEAE